MLPSEDTKADIKTALPPAKIEQPVTDKILSSGPADGQDVGVKTASANNEQGTKKVLKMLSRPLNKHQPELKPQTAMETASLVNHLASLHIEDGEENEDARGSILQHVAALKSHSSKSLSLDATPITTEEHCGSQSTPVIGSGSFDVWSRPEVLSEAGTQRPDSTRGEISPVPLTLSRQEVPERERREDGSYVDQAPIELADFLFPSDPVVAEDGGAETPAGSGSADQQEEEDRTPPPPPPSPEPAARANFEEFFKIQPSRLGGLGAFAVRELRRGETILVERPLLRTTHFQLLPDFHKLSEAAREAFLSLHSGEGDRFSRVERIKNLNSFIVPGGIAIFEIASRFNHACPSVRNVQYVFDNERGVLSLTICQDVVPAGTELSVSYGSSTVDLYSTYGFRCACGGCTPLTDDDIRRLEGFAYGNWDW